MSATAINFGKVEPVVRVLVQKTYGSAPREAGASMLVWENGQSGTIGGGKLEWDAAASARNMLSAKTPAQNVQNIALGPELGQCCGGRVELLFKRIPPTSRASEMVAENAAQKMLPVYLYGAGHVGREIVRVLHGAPFDINWVDVNEARYPAQEMDVERDIHINPAAAVEQAPDNAYHFVLTHSHSHDLEICNRVLSRRFGHLGLIGSATKKARFLRRLAELGHDDASLARLQCPIGDRSLGKTPQAIAIGVAHWLMRRKIEIDEPRGEGRT